MSEVYDIIIAGGGTVACVIAGRLAAADPSLKILVVESGQHSRDVPNHVQPCRYVEHLQPNAATVSFHPGKPNKRLGGRAVGTGYGRAVGGGSVINFMAYVRCAASDYDDWGKFGNKGWSFNELLPFIRKLETFTLISDRPTHGYSGPIQISAGGTDLGFAGQFFEMAKEYDPSRPYVDDINDFKSANAYGRCYKYIHPVTGRRSDAASRYLYPHSGNPNLKIEVGKRVKRVIIENGRAIGIEYATDGISSQKAGDEIVTVKATRMVVISAGAFGSPAILERSGIGGASVLEKNKVDVVVDLPGVGRNYQDHLGTFIGFYASDETETMDDIWRNPEEIAGRVKEWEDKGTGRIAHNGTDILVKIRPTENQLTSAGPAVQSRWESFFERNPDKSMGIIAPYCGTFPVGSSASLRRKYLRGAYYTLYPESIGSVHITSADDLNSPLDFDPNIFAETGDAAQLSMLYKMTRERFRRLPAYRGELAAYHPIFPAGSAACCRETDVPVGIGAPDIVYSEADEEAIAKFHRDTVRMIYHSLGTCAMKPREEGGVLDARLNVYGVESLKVVDLSICPANVGTNTYSTALVIGEKAAVIIAEDLGVKGV